MNSANLKVKYTQITPVNFRIGGVLRDRDNNQYAIVDADAGIAYLIKLRDEEKNKPEFIDGWLSL